jgi:hypothetical protein
MKITSDMKIKEVLAFDEEKMINALGWLAPEFERLQYPKLRRAMSGRVSVQQAARIARLPLAEMLYVLNIAVGENEEALAEELRTKNREYFEYRETDSPVKPLELIDLKDTDEKVVFLNLMPHAEEKRDPMPVIANGLVSLKKAGDVLLLKHPFDPIPLREMLGRRGFSSWAEERTMGVWFIYFYRALSAAEAVPSAPVSEKAFAKMPAVQRARVFTKEEKISASGKKSLEIA